MNKRKLGIEKGEKKLVTIVMTAMIVFSLMPAFVPMAAAADVTAFTITPDTGTAGAKVAYNVSVNATEPWSKLNITIPKGFEMVTPDGDKEIVKADFYGSTGAWCGNISVTSDSSEPSKYVWITSYNKSKVAGDLVRFNIDYEPGATTEFVPDDLKKMFPTWNASINLTLPTATANGSLNVSLPGSMELTNITLNMTGQYAQNPETAGNYTFDADGDITKIVTINPAVASKWYIGTPSGNTTVGTSIPITVNVTDQYGNINNTFSKSYNGSVSLTVTEGTATASISPNATVRLSTTSRNTTKTVNVSAAPAKVKVEVWGGGLTAAEEVLEYYTGVTSIALTLVKTELYANTTDTTTLTAQLKDASGNDIKVQDESITVSEYTTLGLKFDGTSTTTTDTDSDGKATFTVEAGAKDGTATIRASIESGDYAGTSGETSLTLKQAPNVDNTKDTISTFDTITAGVNKVITATLKDYNGTEIKSATDFPVKFNITDGDAKWTENGLKVYEDTSDSIGNVSATLYSTNASAVNKINVTITLKNETLGWETVKTISNIEVEAGVATKLDISPKKSVGLKNVNGTEQEFTLQLQDTYGNDNTTDAATSPVLITTDNEALGNMTHDTTTVNNNLWSNITANGNTTFRYTVNSTVEGTAHLTVNVTDFSITDTITVTTSGPTGLNLTVNKTLPLVGETVMATAQLTSAVGDIAIENVNITFTLRNLAGTLIGSNSTTTDTAGAATYNIMRTTRGAYTIKARNDDYGHEKTNTTTYVGNATQIWIAVNNTSPQVNDTITVYAIFKDDAGYNSSSVDGDDVNFLADDSTIATDAIGNGVASATYTRSTAGTVALDVFYTNATNPKWEGTVPANSTSVTFEGAAPELMEGDITDLNICVDISDALLIARYDVGLETTLTADQLTCGDTNDDGVVDISDAMHVAQYDVDPDGSLGVLYMPLWNATNDANMLQPVQCT